MEVPQAGREDRDYKQMKQAVDEAYRAAARGDGGPFGAVILRDDGAVLASRHNLVRKNTDPSAHAEVAAIRQVAEMRSTVAFFHLFPHTVAGVQEARKTRPLRLLDLRVVRAVPDVLRLDSHSQDQEGGVCLYGAKAEAAVAAGFDASIPDAFVEYYRKSGIEVRQVEGEAARIAEQVFEKAWEAPGEAMRRRRGGGWFEKARGMVKSSRLCCPWD
ncbi:guanosine deaminase-like isoform X2 [Panicum hallii]|uniref:guanosine deaminase-like isoform X2 n=1 Tax=Panicum hallii TaxID=206008 RepID=UPI000DF4ED9F|nr:guanosine deaminase-like isoform X2 [Panicum hallii]